MVHLFLGVASTCRAREVIPGRVLRVVICLPSSTIIHWNWHIADLDTLAARRACSLLQDDLQWSRLDPLHRCAVTGGDLNFADPDSTPISLPGRSRDLVAPQRLLSAHRSWSHSRSLLCQVPLILTPRPACSPSSIACTSRRLTGSFTPGKSPVVLPCPPSRLTAKA